MSDLQKYRIDEEGVLRVRKLSCHRIRGYATFLPDREYEYPCMDTDGDTLFLLAVFGGWFGLHKIVTGHYLSALFYAATCGCAGVFHLCDVLAMLSGNYLDERVSFEEDATGYITQRKERFFNRPLEHKWIGAFGIPAAVGIAVLAVMFLYIPLLSFASGGVLEITPDETLVTWVMEILR